MTRHGEGFAVTVDAVREKECGAYYTPVDIAATLVKWVVHRASDCMLDPSCGDGRFLSLHRKSTGVEQDPDAILRASARAPWAAVYKSDFFTWARRTSQRFDCAAGNPPFIRYQRWPAEVQRQALALCEELGVAFSSLASSWAPFLVTTASLLKPGGRMAFVVPAEIGHATYSGPLLEYLARSFALVRIVAVRKKMFAGLSEDCWLLYTEGFGGRTDHFEITLWEDFAYTDRLPQECEQVSMSEWRLFRSRLRPFLLPARIRSSYRELTCSPMAVRLGDVARVGIGYVTGANDFFHLRPSEATNAGIPREFLHPSVRNGRTLPPKAVTHATVRAWLNRDDPVLLLRIGAGQMLPASVRRYLDTPEAQRAQQTYKCRSRQPWYVVPDVQVPDAFLSYMSGGGAALVANHAKCVCTNSVHGVTLKNGMSVESLQRGWATPLARLSCELEGHPLGGGLLKLEPREAANLVLPNARANVFDGLSLLDEGIEVMKRWRHYV